MKRKEVLTSATMGMNLEDITLGEISQTQQNKYVRLHLHEVLRGVRVTETQRWWVSGAGGRDGACLMGTDFQVGKMRVLELDNGNGHTTK